MRLGSNRLFLSFLGLALARAWVALLFADPRAPGYGSSWGTSLFDIAYVSCALAAVIGFRRIIPLTGKRWTWIVSGALMTLSSVGFIIDGLVGPVPGAFTTVSLMGGAGFLLYTLVNAEVLATQSLRAVILYLSLGRILSFVLTYFLTDLGPDRLAIAVVVLPALALTMTHTALDHVPERQRPQGECPRFTMPWIMLVVLAVYSFVYGLHQSSLTPGVGRYASLFNCVTGILLVIWVVLAPGKLSFRVLCNLPIGFLACGFVLMSVEGALAGVAADALIVLAFNLSKMTVVFLFYAMSRHLGISIVVLSASLAAVEAFGIAGNLVAYGLAAANLSSSVGVLTHVVVIALAFALTLIALTKRDLFSQWGARLLDLDEVDPSEAQREQALSERCDALAEEWRLSSREREVLGLVAQGKTSRQVQDTLFIAEGTFKTHMRHIYEKSGIRGQKRLKQFLENTE